MPKTLAVTHRFVDAFTMMANAELAAQFNALPKPERVRREWLQKQNWLLFDERTNTGQRLHAWIQQQGWKLEPTMRLDDFDLVINLVAIGMGTAFVPIRALALYSRKRNLVRIPLKSRFERELVVVTHKHRVQPKHTASFIEHILF